MLTRPIFRLALLLMRALGWRFSGERPGDPKFILIGAPHTSNWDFLLTLALVGHFDIPLRYMVKDSVFRGPWGGLLKALGGIPIDRSQSFNRVEKTIQAFQQRDSLVLGILPEGTRKRTEFWKSGFYHIAHGAGVPLILARVDARTRTLVLGKRLMPSGDIEADMKEIADYYEGAQGIYPENFGPVRVRPLEEKSS